MATSLVIEGWLSVAEAAERLGISVQRVRQLLQAGELDGRKGPGGWVVAENAVRVREQAPPAAGRPLSSTWPGWWLRNYWPQIHDQNRGRIWSRTDVTVTAFAICWLTEVSSGTGACGSHVAPRWLTTGCTRV